MSILVRGRSSMGSSDNERSMCVVYLDEWNWGLGGWDVYGRMEEALDLCLARSGSSGCGMGVLADGFYITENISLR
ncbi:hypothetical protein [Burkholderia pseudomallei]|uniref:hypothetical protein n=1 Tax=Burkholderia pseudomallei TaxID=28450 RepID=UPI001AD7744B|nr:hypothetical protein [Burkholderia pseudomallei]MBO7786100.1 hypothetical protein [Burkholderia pseudomallei]